MKSIPFKIIPKVFIKNGSLIVDCGKGEIFGKIVGSDGRRSLVGYILDGVKRHTLVIDRKAIILYAKRTIYLAKMNKPLLNKHVEVKDGNENNICFNNLIFKETSGKVMRRWTPEEISIVKKNIGSKSYEKISELVGRTPKAIKHMVDNLKSGITPRISKRKVWTKEDDIFLHNLIKEKMALKDIAFKMNRSKESIYLRIHRYYGMKYSNYLIKEDLNEKDFYHSLKRTIRTGSSVSKCCICGYDFHIELHHLDGNRKNNNISNIASLCPNHHCEVTFGSIPTVGLFSVWKRRSKNGDFGEEKNNKEKISYIKNK